MCLSLSCVCLISPPSLINPSLPPSPSSLPPPFLPLFFPQAARLKQCSVLILRCFDTAVILLSSDKMAESTTEVVHIVSPHPPVVQSPVLPPPLPSPHLPFLLFSPPLPSSVQWENVYQHLNSINAAVKLFQVGETMVGVDDSAILWSVLHFTVACSSLPSPPLQPDTSKHTDGMAVSVSYCGLDARLNGEGTEGGGGGGAVTAPPHNLLW